MRIAGESVHFRLLLVLLSGAVVSAQTGSVRYFYDDTNQLFRALDPAGVLVEWTYDAVGNITAITRQTVPPASLFSFNFTPRFSAGAGRITIYGQNFSTIAASNLVKLGNVVCEVVRATPTELEIVLPTGLLAGSYSLTIQVGANTITAGSIQMDGLVAPIPLPAGQNETTSSYYAIRSGPALGNSQPAGFNEVSSPTYSARNGGPLESSLGAGRNEAVSKTLAVRSGFPLGPNLPASQNETASKQLAIYNGVPLGSNLPANQNETASRQLSVYNGVPLGSGLPAGRNEADSKLFSARNGPSAGGAANPSLPVLSLVRTLDGGAGGSGEQTTGNSTGNSTAEFAAASGETVTLNANLGGDAGKVQYLLDGKVTEEPVRPPYAMTLTLPLGPKRIPLEVRAMGLDGQLLGALRGEIALDSPRHRSLVGRAHAGGARVRGWVNGLRLSAYDLPAEVVAAPDFRELATPFSTGLVSGVQLRNPEGALGVDPLGVGLHPGYAIRLEGQLEISVDGEYLFEGRGGTLYAEGRLVEWGKPVSLRSGMIGIEVRAFAGMDPFDLSIRWTAPNSESEALPSNRLWVNPEFLAGVAGEDGRFEFSGIPGWVRNVRLDAEDATGKRSTVFGGVAEGREMVLRMEER